MGVLLTFAPVPFGSTPQPRGKDQMNDPASSPQSNLQPRRSILRIRPSIQFKVSLLILAVVGPAIFWKVRRDQAVGQAAWMTPDGPSQIAKDRGWTELPDPPFNLDHTLVPAAEIFSGGPRKDDIPALTDPDFVTAQEASYLKPEDRVIGITSGQESRAYPVKILNYHEIINDRLGETPVAVTYCPLCDSAAVFDRRVALGEREFGVSGYLYNSDLLMYDRGGDPESLWSQVMSTGISGPGHSQPLKALPLELTTWADWRERNPHTLVLSIQTGHARYYETHPYQRYVDSPNLMFSVNRTDDRLPNKSQVLGVWTPTAAKAYPLSVFSKQANSQEPVRIEDEVGGIPLTLEYRPGPNSLRVISAGEGVNWLYCFWFAWFAFHPETETHPLQ